MVGGARGGHGPWGLPCPSSQQSIQVELQVAEVEGINIALRYLMTRHLVIGNDMVFATIRKASQSVKNSVCHRRKTRL